MRKYDVILQGIFDTSIVVEAKSEKQAKEKALKALAIQVKALENYEVEESYVEETCLEPTYSGEDDGDLDG